MLKGIAEGLLLLAAFPAGAAAGAWAVSKILGIPLSVLLPW